MLPPHGVWVTEATLVVTLAGLEACFSLASFEACFDSKRKSRDGSAP